MAQKGAKINTNSTKLKGFYVGLEERPRFVELALVSVADQFFFKFVFFKFDFLVREKGLLKQNVPQILPL